MSNTANTLTIDLNEEYKIKIEEPSKLSDSYFKDIYQRAAKATADILKKSEDADKIKDNPFKRQGEEYNNIIAFCGERGTGKSSAMITFAQALLNIEEADLIKKLDVTDKYKLSSYKYFSTEVIDPSMFEEKENIFEVVLAQLFSSFSKKLNDKNSNTNHEQKRKVLEAFQTVYDDLKTVQKNGEKYNGEALETLAKLSCGANLRSNFKDLVQHYLDFIKCDKEDKAYLIIPIDDFDLNVKAVSEMAEQIRKYLMIPKVVILMAADIKQLSDAKEQSVRRDFATLIKADAMTESPKSITAKYILKLIPDQRRLVLPFVQDREAKIELKLQQGGKQDDYWEKEEDGTIKTKETDGKVENIKKEETIQDFFLRLCYQNYHILFVKPQTGIHPIIPSNIRELKEWLLFLTNPPENKIDALNAFNDRFISAYCENNLEKEEDVKLIRLLGNVSTNELHKKIIEEVVNIFKEKNISILNEYQYIVGEEKNELLMEFRNIINRGNYAFNISLGDVILFLDIVGRYHNTERFRKLIFAIKTIITIKLKKAILVNTNNSDFNNLLNGSIFNHKQKSLISNHKASFDIEFSNLDIELINEFDCKTKVQNIRTLQRREFLHFFISYLDKTEFYRQESFQYYIKSLNYNSKISKTSNCTFDILAPFFYLEECQLPLEKIIDQLLESDSIISFNDYEKHNISDKLDNNIKNIYPFESIEVLEEILRDVYINSNSANNFKDEIINFYKELKKFYELLIMNNDYLPKELLNYFTNNKLINLLLTDGNLSQFVEVNLTEAFNITFETDEKYTQDKLLDKVKDARNCFEKWLGNRNLKGITIRNYINNKLTGSKGIVNFVHALPVAKNLIDSVNEKKLPIDRYESFDENAQIKLSIDLIKIIDNWIMENSFNE